MEKIKEKINLDFTLGQAVKFGFGFGLGLVLLSMIPWLLFLLVMSYIGTLPI